MAVDKIDLNNLDKSDWKTYRFDEIVRNISERIDPNNTELKVYIGLEHIDSESLHIKRFGSPDDVNGQKLKFYKGDIIFGRRRAYQRKAGIATCDGFCSAHSLVLRANSDVIAPELLPFFLHSDLFMNRAIDISVGSLSPTINWGTLKHQEFIVPPQKQHAELVRLLSSINEQMEKEIELSNTLEKLYLRLRQDFFKADYAYEKKLLGDLVSIKSGNSPSAFEFAKEARGIPFLKVKDLNESRKFQHFAKEWVTQIENKIISSGSVIFPKRGAAIMTNKVRITAVDCHIDTNTMALKVIDESLLFNEYLYYFLLYKELHKIADTSQIPQINNVHINPYPINLPPIDVQRTFVAELDMVISTIRDVESKVINSKNVQKSLINQVF